MFVHASASQRARYSALAAADDKVMKINAPKLSSAAVLPGVFLNKKKSNLTLAQRAVRKFKHLTKRAKY